MRTRNIVILFLLLVTAAAAFGQTKKPISKTGLVNAVKINGISYRDIGNSKAKSAIVFVHCWTCNSDFWKDNLNGFTGKRVIAVDLPGHGESDKPRVSYTMEHFARAVNTVMEHAGVEKAVLVGHSMGTPITRMFYQLYPNKTLGIVVVDGALKPMFPREAMETFFAPLRTNYKENSSKFLDGMLEPVKDTALRARIKDSMQTTPDYVAVSAMEGMIDDTIWTRDRIDVPVLAIMAPSPFWPKDLKEQYTVLAPKLEFQMWSDVSHFLQMEKPAEFNQQVKGFISQHKLL